MTAWPDCLCPVPVPLAVRQGALLSPKSKRFKIRVDIALFVLAGRVPRLGLQISFGNIFRVDLIDHLGAERGRDLLAEQSLKVYRSEERAVHDVLGPVARRRLGPEALLLVHRQQAADAVAGLGGEVGGEPGGRVDDPIEHELNRITNRINRKNKIKFNV
jgi:hypothetical protein